MGADSARQVALPVLEQAAEWFALLNAERVDDSDREYWQRWLQASPAHFDAWQRVQQVGSHFQGLPAAPSLHALQAPTLTRRRVLRATGVLGLLGGVWLVGGAGWRYLSTDLRTSVGERREVTLSDGTRLWLNSDTRADVDYDPQQRMITLHSGEVLVTTARDSRPLRVQSSHGVMRALGTRFSVRSDEADSVLAVFDGEVDLQCSQRSIRLRAGEQCRFDANGPAPIAPAEVRREAWTRGLLVADNLRLDEVVADLARHHRAHFAVATEVAALRLVGTYRVDDLEGTLNAIQQTLPVAVRRPVSWWISVDARV